MEIVCEFNMSIYNDDNKCILNNVKLGVFGNCETGITPCIPENVLNSYKDNTLKIFNIKTEQKS